MIPAIIPIVAEWYWLLAIFVLFPLGFIRPTDYSSPRTRARLALTKRCCR
jgi:hypothetical protein